MIVGSCFEGDVDMALAGVQHDLYFACSARRPWITIGGGSTLGWIWANAVYQCSIRRRSMPWVDRHFERIRGINRFNHKLLRVPHDHIAASFRWTMPRISRQSIITDDQSQYPLDLLASWKSFLECEIPDLLSADEALVSLVRSIVYRAFDVGDKAYYELQDILMRRYGYECVSQTGWANLVRDRARSVSDALPTTSNQGIANA